MSYKFTIVIYISTPSPVLAVVISNTDSFFVSFVTAHSVSQAVPSIGHPPALSDRPKSPQEQLISSDNKEEFPALPSVAPESSTSARPLQPPVITKPPPAPPIIRKASAPVKLAAKPEMKKPTLPPLATTVPTKGKDRDVTESAQIQSPALEVTSAKTEIKSKKTANDTTATNTPVTPAAAASSMAKGGKHAESTSKASAAKSKEAKPSSSSANVTPVPEPVVEHAPILARQTRKSKPQQLPKKKPVVVKEDPVPTKESTPEPPSNITSAVEAPVTSSQYSFSPSNIQHLLAQLHDARDLRSTRFFNEKSLKSSSLDNYGPIVDALASISLAVSGGAVDTSTADAAMVAFLQLHSALMDMILEMRNMMPHGYWSDNQKFEAALQDMRDTKATGYSSTGEGSEGMAKKARWMHTQCERLPI
jgi:hypothetical protein